MDYRVRQRFMCLLEFLYWASLCSNSYLSQFLRETGMSGVAVGSAMAAIAFVGMAAPPVFGIISDKIGSSRRVFILCWFVTAAAWLWVPLTGSTMLGGLSLAVIVMVGGSAFRLSAASILDSWMLQIQDAGRAGEIRHRPAVRFPRLRCGGRLLRLVPGAQPGNGVGVFSGTHLRAPGIFHLPEGGGRAAYGASDGARCAGGEAKQTGTWEAVS